MISGATQGFLTCWTCLPYMWKNCFVGRGIPATCGIPCGRWIGDWKAEKAFCSTAHMVSTTAPSLQYTTSEANAASKKASVTAILACVCVCVFLRVLRSVIDENMIRLLKLACLWLDHINGKNQWERTTPLLFIIKDSDFKKCCRERNYLGFKVVPGDKTKGELDSLCFGTASGQERKGNEAKGSQEGNTPTASGQDAAPVPVQNTAAGQDAATVPDLNTASGQDAAPHTASNEGKVQKGSDVDEAVGSKQEPGPESQEHHGIKRTHEEIQHDELLQENATLKRMLLLQQEMQKEKPDLIRAI